MSIVLDKERSPFKFLDPYDKQDKDYFFGRELEEDTLYEFVNENRLVLVYGQSGTGKTSLVQCGLSKRFDSTDWLPFYIRRGRDINESLRTILQQSKAIGGSLPSQADNDEATRLIALLELIGKRYMRPVYLIFDQFEELLILGREDEKEQFLNCLAEMVNASGTQGCNFLFILREEFFACLDIFEKAIKGFSDKRMRVEPMRPKKIERVIIESCDHFHLRLQSPERAVKLIMGSLDVKSEFFLPYLQVFLDQLWREAFARAFPSGYTGETYPELIISIPRLQRTVKMGNVLRKFLMERRLAIQAKLKAAHPTISNELVKNVLDSFVTEEGTKLPVAFQTVNEEIVLADNAPDLLKALDPGLLTAVLKELEANRLLRSDGETYELAHDLLAAIIDQTRSDVQRILNLNKKTLRLSYDLFRQTGEYLSASALAKYEDQIPEMNLNAGIQQFIGDSRKHHELLRDAELREARKKMKEEKARAEREQKYRVRITYFSVLVTLLLVIAGWQTIRVKNAKDDAENSKSQLARNLQITDSLFKQSRSDYDSLKVLQNIRRLRDMAESDKIKPRLYELLAIYKRFVAARPAIADSVRTDIRNLIDKNSENPQIKLLQDSLKNAHIL